VHEDAEGNPRRERGYEKSLRGRGAHLAARVGSVPTRCWFCESTEAALTHEHIFPRWLQKKLGIENELVTPTHLDAYGRVIDRRGALPLSALVGGHVCVVCNSGWMNSLERPFEAAMFDQPRTGLITRAQRLDLARWFAKTAAVLNTSQNYRHLLPDSTRHTLGRSSGLPPGFQVYLARSQTGSEAGEIDWARGLSPFGFIPSDVVNPAVDGSERLFGCAIRVQDVVGTVYFAPPEYSLIAVTAMVGIWPRPHHGATWSSLPALESLHEGLVAEFRTVE
jgi:hypothetical protein